MFQHSPHSGTTIVYFIGNNDVLKQFTSRSRERIALAPPRFTQDTFAYMFPGGQPVVSSNGTNNAIVWATDWMTGTLRAYDATNVSNVLYVSPKLGGGHQVHGADGRQRTRLPRHAEQAGDDGASCRPAPVPRLPPQGVNICSPAQDPSSYFASETCWREYARRMARSLAWMSGWTGRRSTATTATPTPDRAADGSSGSTASRWWVIDSAGDHG